MNLIRKIHDWFNNLNLKTKLAIIIFEMAIFLVFLGLIGFYLSYRENQNLLLLYQNRLVSIKWLNSVWANIRENEAAIYKIILISDPATKKRLASEVSERGHLWLVELDSYSTVALHDPYEDVVLPSLQKKALKYTEIRDRSVQFALAGKRKEFENSYFTYLPLLDNIIDTLKDLSEYNEKMAEKEYKASLKQAGKSYFIIVGAILFSLAVAIALGLIIIANITAAIHSLAEKMKQVALGNLDVDPIEIKYKDEIGVLSESFNLMTDNLRRIILKEKIAREKEDFLRQELEEQRKTFLATLTHDLRSPLIAEQKALEAILSKSMGVSLDDFAEYLEDMHKTNDELLTIVNNLLIMDYYESESIDLELELKNIKDVIENSLKSIRPLAKDNDSGIVLDVQPDLPLVRINSSEINRVIINLVSNAIKHNKKGTDIKIAAKSRDNSVLVSISDNGKGIPEEEKPNIFRKYPATKRKIGSGLGLYLSKQIIDAHNGRIWFESEEGKGSTFFFVLPVG